MNFDPIGVEDKFFYAFKQIELSEAGMMVRELTKNGIEAALTADEDDRRIFAGSQEHFGVPKLYLFNTGVGMDADHLYRMGDLACSTVKIHALDENFGEGAKVSGLRHNSLGMIYESCKDGVVSRMHLAKFGDNQYGRHVYPDDPRVSQVANSILDVTDDYTEEERSFDWTGVVLLGQRKDQNTVIDPYNDGNTNSSWLAEELWLRFFRIDPTVRITLDVGHRQKGTREFKTFEERMLQDTPYFTRYETVITDTGVKIHFIYDEKNGTGRQNSVYHGPLQSTATFGGIVYKDEIYSLIKGDGAWTAKAPKLGITFGARFITVLVELPDNYPLVPESHRKNLLTLDRHPIVLEEYFAELVNRNRPEWIKELIASYRPKHEDSLDDLQKRLRDLMHKEMLKVDAKVVTKEDADTTVEDLVGDTIILHLPENEGCCNPGEHETRRHNPRPQSDGSNAARNRLINPQMFDIEFLRTEQEVAEKNLTGKAASYIRTGNGTVFINTLYSKIDRLYNELAPNYATADQELFRIRATQLIEEHMIMRICSTVIYALAKQRAAHWNRDGVDKALSPESLSMAADADENDARKIVGRLNAEFNERKVAAAA